MGDLSAYLSDSDMSDFSGFNPSDIDSDLEFSSDSEFSDHDSDDLDDVWTDNFTMPTIEPFTEEPGPHFPDDFDPDTATPLQYFLLLFPMHLIRLLVTMTNGYAMWYMAQPGVEFDSRWEEVTVEEMRAFLAINIVMGINQLPDLTMYWSSDNFIGNSAVMSLMTCNRFQRILRYLHVSDRVTEPAPGQPGYHKLVKVKPVIDVLSETFRQYYTLSREVAVDEAMIAFSGRLSYRQYMPAKPIKRGFKVWMLCDSATSYLSRFEVYLGRQGNQIEHGLGHSVVLKLTDHLRHTHRFLFFDNFFTGIPLMEELLQHGLYACGTVRVNRKGFPQALKKPAGVRNRGDFRVLQKQDSNLCASVWKDKKLVYHLSTLSDPQQILSAQRRSGATVLQVDQPHSVNAYNHHMGGVDTHDQYRMKYSVGRNGKKPWRYLFWFLLNCSIVNSFIMYNTASRRNTRRRRFTHLHFRLELVKELIGGFRKRKRPPTHQDVRPLVDVENVNGHVSVRMEGKRRKCKFHSQHLQERKDTSYGCGTCNVYLCRHQCHARYHNLGR